LPIEDVVSAGGVVYRRVGEEVQVVVCGRQTDNGWVWSLPKGHVDPGESVAEAALREVTEETGLQVAIQEELGAINYWFTSKEEGKRYHKTVHHFLMTPTGGSLEEHDREFDRVEWLEVGEALRRLTYPNEAELVRQALARIQRMS